MLAASDPRKNHLLAALPAAEWLRWKPQLEACDMPLGEVLYESGGTLSHVCFPTTAIISLLYVLENGASAEIAIVGNEGVVGSRALHGRRVDAEPRCRAECGQRLQAGVGNHEGRVQAGTGAAPHAALHPGTHHADVADGCLQPPSLARPAALPLAVAQPGPAGGRRARDDPGADRQHARRAPGRRDRRGAEAAEGRPDPLLARPHQGARPRRPGSAGVRVLCGSRPSTTDCCRT